MIVRTFRGLLCSRGRQVGKSLEQMREGPCLMIVDYLLPSNRRSTDSCCAAELIIDIGP